MPEFKLDLSNAEHRRVTELIAALRTSVDSSTNAKATLMVPKFVDEFLSRLLSQHVFLGNPLFQESFDTAFYAAAMEANFKVSAAPTGQRFWDLQVNGKKISLKSSKAKSLRKETLHISKLTEAAWIQDCRTAKQRHAHTLELFKEYCREVDEIIQLRYFGREQLYELVGVPVKILKKTLQLPVSAFGADGPTINIPIGLEPPDFTLKLDRSDAKVTLANILKANCTTYGTWKIAQTSDLAD